MFPIKLKFNKKLICNILAFPYMLEVYGEVNNCYFFYRSSFVYLSPMNSLASSSIFSIRYFPLIGYSQIAELASISLTHWLFQLIYSLRKSFSKSFLIVILSPIVQES